MVQTVQIAKAVQTVQAVQSDGTDATAKAVGYGKDGGRDASTPVPSTTLRIFEILRIAQELRQHKFIAPL